MATVSFISPKVMLNKLAEALYTPAKPQKSPATNEQRVKKASAKKTVSSAKNKLNVTKDDVKIISAALIHYKKFLARKKQMDEANEVGDVDKKFMAFINALERTPVKEEPQKKPPHKKTLKRTVVTQDVTPDKEYKTPKLPQEVLQTEWVVKKPKTKKRSAS